MIRKGMKAMVAALGVTAVVAGASVAQAAITFDPDGVGGAGAVGNVTQLDWAPGNTLAVGGQTAVDNFLAGSGDTTFATYYQASLQAFRTAGGDAYAPAGWEITVVAKFTETVIAANAALGQATFAVLNDPNNYVEIYAHRIGDAGTTTFDDLAGTGFNDGIRILQGHITGGITSLMVDPNNVQDLDQNGSNDYPNLDSVTSLASGISISALQIDILDANSDYFQSTLDSLTLAFSGTAQTPFDLVDPSGNFLVNSTNTALGVTPTAAGAGAPFDPVYGIGTVNGQDGPSIQIYTDGNSAVNGSTPVIPEPATAAMGLIGLAGLAIASRRRRA